MPLPDTPGKPPRVTGGTLDERIANARKQLDAHVVDIVRWHFSPDTGTLVWVGAFGLALFAGIVLTAEGFWDSKPFTAWSDKELQQIMTDSPWAKKVRPEKRL